MDTIYERFEFSRKELGISYAELGDLFEISGDAVRKGVIRGNLKKSYLNKFSDKYFIDKDWLFNNVGEFKIIQNNTNHDATKELTKIKEKKVPFYNFDFSGGWASEEIFSNLKPDFFIYNPEFERSDFACNLYGNSVSKIIPSGAIIGLKKIYDWQIYFPSEYLYGIITKNDLRTVKFVKKNKDNRTLTLISCPENNAQEEEIIPIDFITEFYQIVAWAKYERLII